MINYADTKVTGEGDGGGSPSARAVVPLQHVVQTGEAAVPLQSMEDHGGSEIHLQPMEETHAEAGGFLKETVTLWETHAGRGSLQGSADLWKIDPHHSSL
ncbi:protein pxr1-like [Willisornis vidua]|uniref:Protein pxr1-like n=1 Tax=Willisornis vidua TaxID=1566151 RepID=A0ABQ9DBH5_9PASS|nr:protein pxr1-like [Willisornis vidua]